MAEVKIKISAEDKASKAIGDVKKSLADIPKDAKKAAVSFSDIANAVAKAGAAAVAVGAIVNQAFEFGERGAILTQTAEGFDRITQSLGAPPDLLNKLRAAANGTVTDLRLMSATNTLLAGTTGELGSALAGATPQLLEIARAANKLNPALGDTEFMYQSLALGIKRNSPLILDNPSLTIKIGEANERYAAQLGKTVEQLTADEQKQALLNETLRAGAVLIEQAGGNAAAATDGYSQMWVAIENLVNELAQRFDPAMRNAAKTITVAAKVMGGAIDEAMDAQAALNTEVAATATTYDEYLRAQLEVARMTRGLSSAGAELLYQFMQTGVAVGRTETEYLQWAQAMGVANIEQWKINRAAQMMYAAMQPIPQVTNDVIDSLARFDGIDMQTPAKGAAELGRNMDAVANATRSAQDAASNYFAFVDRNIGDTIANLKKDIEFIQAGGAQIVAEFERVKAGIASGAITPEEGQQALDGLFVAAQNLDAELGNITAWEAANNIRETLGVSMEEAYAILKDFKATLTALNGSNITVTIDVKQMAAGVTGAGTDRASANDFDNAPAIPQATGGDWMVTKPTLFLAGEAGAERATFTPQNGAQPIGGESVTVNIYAAVLDENAARRGATMGVQAALRARGAA